MSLFKKFEPKPDLGPATALKSSVRRVIRQKLCEQYPVLAEDEGALLEAAWPNKASVTTVKFAREHVQMLISDKQVLFFQHYDDWYLPSLRLLHKFPEMLPSVQVDRGAIKFVLSGANVMSPGLVSAGGKLPDPSKGEQPIKEGECVAIRAQGKNEILAVGVMKMDSEQVRKTGKGIAIENIHYLGDDLWLTLSKGGI
ncbi:translation machinery-associated protein 20 [Moesziomyces antarcticus]|uniref:Translation machinery-associated protein 20 n=1 Tax=Pseudozyma antarctica TaxID=84753 RepID=A0A5C3FGB0_PSEA2|nr:translation machinery-associated protein 20 [Moesziomyces antarcticus]GAK62658.1 translation machinery-associated protein 20 [Moesziomyces antarcticus]SPO43220.1 related to TMA20 - Protein putative involved in cytoplasmic ribosome function [Moesziomyces antarcticus]